MNDKTSLDLCHPDTVGWMRKAWEKAEGTGTDEVHWHLIGALCCELGALRQDITRSFGHLATVVGETNAILHQELTKGP